MKPQDLRRTERHLVTIELSEHLVSIERKKTIRCFSKDISERGIGIVSFEPILENETTELRLPKTGRHVELIATSCELLDQKKRIYKIGFKTKSQQDNLIEILLLEGLLSKDPISEELDTDVGLRFEEIAGALKRIRYKDTRLLKKLGLDSMSQNYDCFPTEIRGVDMVAIVPKKMVLAGLQSQEKFEIMQSVSIVTEASTARGRTWTKVWPSANEIRTRHQTAPKTERCQEAESA